MRIDSANLPVGRVECEQLLAELERLSLRASRRDLCFTPTFNPMLHTLFTTPHRATLLRNLRDSRSITASLDAFEAILDDLGKAYTHPWEAMFVAGETDTSYTYTTALPGFKRDKVSVEVTNERDVHVTATRADASNEQRVFDRTITLPVDADPAKVEAKLEDGMLTLQIAKLAQPAPRKVVIS